MGLIPDGKLIELVEGVAGVRTRVDGMHDTLEKLETKVDRNSLRLEKIEKVCNGGIGFGNLDMKSVLKYGIILVGMLIAGSAGGGAILDLVRMALGM